MFVDFEALKDTTRRYRVIVVGAGPAGLTLATEMEARGIRCLLVEAGGLEYPDPDGLDPYVGNVVNRPYPLPASRLRYFGGSSGHWGGWVRPLDPEDFKASADDGVPGWPVSPDDVYARLDRVHQVLEIDGEGYDADALGAVLKPHVLALDGCEDFVPSVFRFSPPVRLGTRERPAVAAARHVDCVLRTSLVDIRRLENGRTALVLRDAGGATLEVRADAHVLAMGGIENARALLWGNRERAGLAGGGGWIGRCFADHFGLTRAVVLTTARLDYARRQTAQGALMPRITPSPAWRAKGCINHMLSLDPISSEELLDGDYGLNQALFGSDTARLMHYRLVAVAGQRPNPASRVRLGDALDRNGVARIELDWRLVDRDFTDVFASVERFGRWLASTGRGRLRKVDFSMPQAETPLSVGMHHLGTTRMADSARHGVVDPQCRVFDTDDLYVAGSSIFPTFGYANPTLTIVALALRLADHLAGQLETAR